MNTGWPSISQKMGTNFQCHLAISEYIYFTTPLLASLCGWLTTFINWVRKRICFKLNHVVLWTKSGQWGRTSPVSLSSLLSTALTPLHAGCPGCGFSTPRSSPALSCMSDNVNPHPKDLWLSPLAHTAPTSDLGRRLCFWQDQLWVRGSPSPLLELDHLLEQLTELREKV